MIDRATDPGSHPDDASRAHIHVVPWLTPGVSAMTLGSHIFVRRGNEHDRALLAHELVHVRQWRELGVVGFLRAYLGAYAAGRFRGLGHWAAYAAIPLEVEARDIAGS
jgi:uncharacterized protein DUF4157